MATTEKKTIVTPIFRVSFPHVFEARAGMDGGEPKFGLTAVWNPATFSAKDKERWNAMKALADDMSVSKFKKKIKDLPDNFKKPVRKGEEKEGLDGFGPGLLFANLTTKFKPGLIDKDKIEIIDQTDFYPGCYARATITCYAYENKGKGVAFGLMNIQKIADGARLDSRTDAAGDFEDEEISAEDQKWLDAQEKESGKKTSTKKASKSSDDDDGGF